MVHLLTHLSPAPKSPASHGPPNSGNSCCWRISAVCPALQQTFCLPDLFSSPEQPSETRLSPLYSEGDRDSEHQNESPGHRAGQVCGCRCTGRGLPDLPEVFSLETAQTPEALGPLLGCRCGDRSGCASAGLTWMAILEKLSKSFVPWGPERLETPPGRAGWCSHGGPVIGWLSRPRHPAALDPP